MSWDIFVQDLPPGLSTVEDFPDDFVPGSIGRRSEIVAGIQGVVPDVDFTDPTWGRIEGPDYSIEVNLGDEDPVTSFAFHIHGGEMAAGVVADILDRLQLRAIDPQSDSGLFDEATAEESLRRWRAYRDQAIAQADRRVGSRSGDI